MSTAAIEIPVTANTEPAEKAVESFVSQMVGRLTPTIDVTKLAAGAWNLLTGAIGGVVDNIGDWVEASSEAEQMQRKLATALGDGYDRIAAYNSALSAKLGVDDDDLAATQSKLLALGVSRTRLEEATEATLGLAAATGKDLTAATKQVSRAFIENGDEARRLHETYAVAVEQSQTFEGRLKALDTATGDLKETLGDAITKSEGVRGGLDAMAFAAREFAGFLASSDGRVMVDSFFVTIAHGAADAINGMVGMLKLAEEMNARITLFKAGLIGAAFSDLAPDSPINTRHAGLTDLADRLAGIRGGIGAGVSGSGAGSAGEKPGRAGRAGKDEQSAEELKQVEDFFKEQRRAEEQGERELRQVEEFQRKQREKAAKEKLSLQEIEQRSYLRSKEDFARERRRQQEEEERSERQYWGQLGGIVGSGLSGILGSIAASAAVGASIDTDKMFGGILMSVGQAAISMGTAAVLAGTLGTVAPWLAPATGGPAGIAAGLALIAGGALLTGAGAAAIGGPPGKPAAAAPPPSAGPSFNGGGGFSPSSGSGGGPTTNIIQVSLGRGVIMGGTPRQLAVQLGDILRQGDTLNPVRRR